MVSSAQFCQGLSDNGLADRSLAKILCKMCWCYQFINVLQQYNGDLSPPVLIEH